MNRWREQIGQPSITNADLPSLSRPVEIGSANTKLFDLGGDKQRILAAMLVRDDQTWFFKMTGDNALLREQKSAFVAFLKSISFHDEPTPKSVVSTNINHEPKSAPPKPSSNVPPTWQEQPPSQMVVESYAVSNNRGTAKISVSRFDGNAGGALANVNRWRGQIGLAEVDQAALAKLATAFDPASPAAILVDISGTDVKTNMPARLVGAIVPRGGQTWFYKLMGEPSVVEVEKAAFLKFVQTGNHGAP